MSIRELLEIFTLEEIFEQCNLDPEEVLEFLIGEGLMELTPFMLKDDDGTIEES